MMEQMTLRRQSPFALGPWRTLLALLCIVLVMATATVELTHSHADGDHADCALCVVAHVVIQAATVLALIVLFARISAVALAARVLVLAKATLFAFYTRPPPACLIAA
jgi:hypothetical protein